MIDTVKHRPSPSATSKPRKPPAYRLHKGSGQAVVTLNGRECYLGAHGTKESREAYDRLIATWLANGRKLPVESSTITIAELCDLFMEHAEVHYRRPDGTTTSEIVIYKDCIGIVTRLYGTTRAAEFSPMNLKVVRTEMIKRDWVRSHLNRSVSRVRRIFKWGVSEGLVPVTTYSALMTLDGLRAGRTEVRESEPVLPVPEAYIDAIRPFVSAQVQAMIDLQLLTGARSGEVVRMRACDLDTSGRIWTYTPAHHKTTYRGHARVIYIGPRAKNVIKPFLARRAVDAFLFSPREAEASRLEKRRAERKTPGGYGNGPGTNRVAAPRRAATDHYTVASYRRAISYGVAAANRENAKAVEEKKAKRVEIPNWHPHQLRHNAATNLRKEFGLDAARVILGHRTPAITDIYAELDRDKAIEIIGRVG